jgi:prophage regulatory protein
MTDRILRFPEVKKLSGMSRSTIYLRITEGLFPRPIQLGARMVGWRESEVATMNG